MIDRTTDRPIDLLEHGIDRLLRKFHRAVFLIRRPKESLDEEAMLRHFNQACAYCASPFTPERRMYPDQVIATQDFGDPWMVFNSLCACARCKRVRNGSWISGFMNQILGPALGVDSSEIERRLRKIFDWTSRYRPLTPQELFGPDYELYQQQLDALKKLEANFLELLKNVEARLGVEPEANPQNFPDSHDRRKERIAANQAELRRRHSIQNGGNPGSPAQVQNPLGKPVDSR